MAPVRLPHDERERMLALELRRTQALLERLIDSSPDAVVACDLTGRVVLFNKAAEILTGYQADEIIGHPETFQRLYDPKVAKANMQRMRSSQHGPPGKLNTHGRSYTEGTHGGKTVVRYSM